jgi:predicted nucleic acid-binding protein
MGAQMTAIVFEVDDAVAAQMESEAARSGLSLNDWLVRAVALHQDSVVHAKLSREQVAEIRFNYARSNGWTQRSDTK